MTSDRYDIIYFSETDSTNLQASALLSERKDKQPFIVVSGFQHKGKGQSVNAWDSERGKNLLCSIVVFPGFLNISNHFYLSKAAALALHDTLKGYIVDPEIKWPNDILVNERKISGILNENTLQNNVVLSSIIGVGLNVNQADFPSFNPEATSILNETGKTQNPDFILQELIVQFDYWFDVLSGEDWDMIDSSYMEHLYRINRYAGYSTSGKTFTARIAGVEPDGHLLLETQDKTLQRFGFREVAFI